MGISWKLRKGQQSRVKCRLDLIHIPIILHEDKFKESMRVVDGRTDGHRFAIIIMSFFSK